MSNPLTSLRSAVETLPLAKTEQSRQRLLAVIQHDVKRLDRLISDISDASRLDAELQRQEAAPVDLAKLLDALVKAANEMRTDDVNVTLAFEGGPLSNFKVPGHDSRLGQVVSNLIDNARSFSPPGGSVRITCRRLKNEVEIVVDDDGPGIRPEALDKIFERFYTDRPHQGFGQNSGLGLSISKQIVEAHGGTHLGREPHHRRRPHRGATCARRPLRGSPARDMMAAADSTIHASAVLVGAKAVLIRGPAGSGKSQLAWNLLTTAAQGVLPFARLVADDRAYVESHSGRLLVRPPHALAGLIEIRGLGIRRVEFEPLAAVGLVVDLAAEDAARYPEQKAASAVIAAVTLPRLAVAAGMAALPLVLATLQTPPSGD